MPVRKSIEITRAALRRLFFQRCFYLFFLLLLADFNAFIVLSAAVPASEE